MPRRSSPAAARAAASARACRPVSRARRATSGRPASAFSPPARRASRRTNGPSSTFVRRANEAIPNRRYRPEVSTAPPDDDLDTVLADLPDGPLVLELDARPPGRTFVETARGVRLADLHPGGGPAVRLRLPVDEGVLFVQQAGEGPPAGAGAREFPLPAQPGHVRLSTLIPAPPRVRARGAAHEAFLMLFSRPFDATVVATFNIDDESGRDGPPLSEAARRRHRLGKTTIGISLVGIALGAGCAGTAALIKNSDSPGNSGVATSNRNAWIRGLDIAAWTLIGAGTAALATGATLLLWPDKEAPVAVTAFPGGAAIGYRGRF